MCGLHARWKEEACSPISPTCYGPRLAWMLAGLPVELPGRLRSDQVMRLPAPPRQPGTNGRLRKHGRELVPSEPAVCPDPHITASTATSHTGNRCGRRLGPGAPAAHRRAAWLDHDGDLPVIEGTLIRLQVDHMPGDRDPKQVWLWWSCTGAAPGDVDRCWRGVLAPLDPEHTFRLFKQVLGWTVPDIRDPGAADQWTWLNIGTKTAQPAGAPKHGPGRPRDSKNRHPVPRHDGKTTKRGHTPSRRTANAHVKRQAPVREPQVLLEAVVTGSSISKQATHPLRTSLSGSSRLAQVTLAHTAASTTAAQPAGETHRRLLAGFGNGEPVTAQARVARDPVRAPTGNRPGTAVLSGPK